MICFDLDFTDTARSAARLGAQIAAVPAWDPPGIADSHYTLLVFRAVENRLTMVKSDAAHDSAIIDPYGRIVALSASAKDHRATLVADVPLGSGKSPWVSLGNLWGWLLVAAILVLGMIDLVTWRRAKH
jgi:apolipoprotein N-acyltransferase